MPQVELFPLSIEDPSVWFPRQVDSQLASAWFGPSDSHLQMLSWRPCQPSEWSYYWWPSASQTKKSTRLYASIVLIWARPWPSRHCLYTVRSWCMRSCRWLYPLTREYCRFQLVQALELVYHLTCSSRYVDGYDAYSSGEDSGKSYLCKAQAACDRCS